MHGASQLHDFLEERTFKNTHLNPVLGWKLPGLPCWMTSEEKWAWEMCPCGYSWIAQRHSIPFDHGILLGCHSEMGWKILVYDGVTPSWKAGSRRYCWGIIVLHLWPMGSPQAPHCPSWYLTSIWNLLDVVVRSFKLNNHWDANDTQLYLNMSSNL